METSDALSTTTATRLAEMKMALKKRLAELDCDIDSLILKQDDEAEAVDVLMALKAQVDGTLTTLLELKQKNFVTFTLFPKLPIELRIKIWKASILPRVLHEGRDMTHVDIWANSALTTYPHTPPILHTCRESRQIGLKVYEQICAVDDDIGETAGDGRNDPYQIYINFQVDTILKFIAPFTSTRMYELKSSVIPRVRYIAIHPERLENETGDTCLSIWRNFCSGPYPFGQREEIDFIWQVCDGPYDKSPTLHGNLTLVEVEEKAPGIGEDNFTWHFDWQDPTFESEWLEEVEKHMKKDKLDHPEWKMPEVRFITVENSPST